MTSDASCRRGRSRLRGNRIVGVDPCGEADSTWRAKKRIDATGMIVMPGLVSCHGHACNSLVRGMAEDRPLHEWLTEVLWPAMSQAGPDEIYHGALLSAVEMLRSGVTCFADMWTEVPATARAVEQVGLRALLAYNLRDFGDRDRTDLEIDRAVGAWRECDGMSGGRIRIGLGPHSVYACTAEMLRRARELATEHGLLLQIHVSETRREFKQCVERHGRSPIAYLERMEFLGPDVIAAHVVWLGDGDLEILKQREVSVAHCVASNLKLGSGVAPVRDYRNAGIAVGVGTDGPASNNSLDILADLKIAALLSERDRSRSERDAGGGRRRQRRWASILGLGDELGRLVPGHLADLILVDRTGAHFTPFHPEDPGQVYAHLVYSAKSTDVRTVIVDGHVRMFDGTTGELDEKSVIEGAQRASSRVLVAAGLLPHRESGDSDVAPRARRAGHLTPARMSEFSNFVVRRDSGMSGWWSQPSELPTGNPAVRYREPPRSVVALRPRGGRRIKLNQFIQRCRIPSITCDQATSPEETTMTDQHDTATRGSRWNFDHGRIKNLALGAAFAGLVAAISYLPPRHRRTRVCSPAFPADPGAIASAGRRVRRALVRRPASTGPSLRSARVHVTG